MNQNKSFNVFFYLFIIAMITSCSSNQESSADANSAIKVIHQRTSIRTYYDRKVSKEQLETIVRAGMAAPSAMNKQPWMFIVVDDKDVLEALGKDIQTSKMVQQASAAIIVCGDMRKTGEGWLQQYWIQDCSAASQNILLAITDLGLAGVWTSVYPAENRMEIVANILNLPEYLIPLNIIPVGYSRENKEALDKWKPENLHWGKFSEK